jgi:hypothetical protein
LAAGDFDTIHQRVAVFDLLGMVAGPTPEDLGQDDTMSVPKWEAARRAGRHWLAEAEPIPDLVEN